MSDAPLIRHTVQFHDGASSLSPFRSNAWAVVEGRNTLIAWCFTEESAQLLRLALDAKAGDRPSDLRLQAAILERAR